MYHSGHNKHLDHASDKLALIMQEGLIINDTKTKSNCIHVWIEDYSY